ncbi:MAG TPA: hypothetical protein VGN73_09245 [Gemmatimonadaceae bacterium]|nr:hypothetical protein [Gemmatimonadaceae bacterium]
MTAQAWAILVSLMLPFAAIAQGDPINNIERGSKIRVTAASIPDSEKIGRLDSIRENSIYFRPDSRLVPRSVPLRDVRAVEVSTGIRTRKAEYAAVTAVVGAVIGFISSNHNGTGIGTGKTDASQNAIVGGVAGAAIGGALGWWIGGKKKTEDWRLVLKQ